MQLGIQHMATVGGGLGAGALPAVPACRLCRLRPPGAQAAQIMDWGRGPMHPGEHAAHRQRMLHVFQYLPAALWSRGGAEGAAPGVYCASVPAARPARPEAAGDLTPTSTGLLIYMRLVQAGSGY